MAWSLEGDGHDKDWRDTMFANFMKDESGATIIEYTLLAALIGVALIATMESLEGSIDSKMTEIKTKLDSAGAGE